MKVGANSNSAMLMSMIILSLDKNSVAKQTKTLPILKLGFIEFVLVSIKKTNDNKRVK